MPILFTKNRRNSLMMRILVLKMTSWMTKMMTLMMWKVLRFANLTKHITMLMLTTNY